MWFPYQMWNNIYWGARPAFITEADLASPEFNMGNPVTDKDVYAVATANSIRDFLDYEVNYSGDRGAIRVAVWLLNDDCNPNAADPGKAATCRKHQWSQAYNSNPGAYYFRQWFGQWWYGPEPHVP